ncbi:MAG: hypothetical protein Q8P62_04585 [Candidatus Peregrinibacteria bacterium]|nr:hypothetical protein [Candidatus Peregrinibacteria bacterium]
MENDQNEIKKTYVNLMALKQNLPKSLNIEDKYANMFNNELDRLITIGFKIEDFKIPLQEIKKIFESGNYVIGEQYYSDEKYVDREIILMKLDAILAYFSISNPETKIGFKID